MSIYNVNKLDELLSTNTYPGRGIVIGKSQDGANAVFAYFIMGRSENSRNRIFEKKGEEIIIYPFDASKVEDPSLIIYSPVRKYENNLIVTNGNQTDTIYDFLAKSSTFEEALNTREFEPDKPNFTPRISGILNFDNTFTYKLSILKSEDEAGSQCARYTYSYNPINGLGHFISTYNHDGNPIPTFTGEPKRVEIENDINAFANKIWNSLNENNKISLYVRYTNLDTNEYTDVLINKNK